MKYVLMMFLLSGKVETKGFKNFAECKKAAHVFMQTYQRETAVCLEFK